MPIWLRKFTLGKLQEYYSNQTKEINKATTPSTPSKQTSIKKPTYAVKARQ